MRSLRSISTALVILGFFALNTVSSPFPWKHPSWSGSPPSPVAPAPAPATTTTTTTSSTNSDDTSTTSSSSSTGSNSGSSSSSGGSSTPGQALIVNKCTFPTYLYVCKQHPASCGATTTIAANTGTYSEPYAPSSEGGHSLKISVSEGSADVLQFEYTNEGDGQISYDLSEVDGNPFGQWGFSLTNMTADAYCAPPATSCPAIFTQPTNGVPYTCSTADGIGAILCG